MTSTEIIRDRIVAYFKAHGRCPNFASIGSNWTEAQPVFDAMIASGELVREVKVSPKGRRTPVLRLAEDR